MTTAVDQALFNAELDLRRQKPWLFAAPFSIWEVYGKSGDTTIVACNATVLPAWGDGDRADWDLPPELAALNVPLFRVNLDAPRPLIMPATEIERARELIFVFADDPLTADNESNQPLIDEALARRDESR